MVRFRNKGITSSSTRPGKLFATLFGLVFMGMGLLFASFIVRQTMTDFKILSWEKTPCAIISGRVTTVSDGYAFEVEYAYRVKGADYHSRQFKSGFFSSTHDDVSKADALARRYAPGADAFCFVNPDNPAEAVLARGSLWTGLLVLFPMIFVVIGGAVIYGAWTAGAGKTKAYSLSAKASRSKYGRFFLAGFFLIFLVAGSAFGYFLVFPALTKYLNADNWVETPCVVQSSRVKSHDSDDGTTYSVDIVYEYNFNGQPFRSGKYRFIGGSSSGYAGKAAVVDQYPPGRQAICYVNPDDPAEAVLIRTMGPEALMALIPLIFMIVGLGGFIYALRTGNAAGAIGSAGTSRRLPARVDVGSGRMILKPQSSAAGKIIVSMAVAAFWNGIVSVFVYQAYAGWRTGNPDYFLMLFLIPFVLVGLVLIGGIFYFILAAFNPRPTISLETHVLRPGDATDVDWNTSGNVYNIREFKLLLIGEETATYRRGTDTCTDRQPFYEKVLAASADPETLRRGQTSLRIPSPTMHSFKSDNNAIVWKIRLQCEVPRWPDIKEDFEITVYPLESEAS
ncbi:MAG: DUF3592 domain-containing protein [Thermodesulfobacteriota bacterium]